ncbi:MAG: hypothetical protein GY822_27825 [Deltaproteobacteria bacterium]|nr:hypothetical protein [Deltaproteobacteria bacterium]
MVRALRTPTLVYEVVLESFCGDDDKLPLVALRDRLPHLASLYVNGLVLPPIFPATDKARRHITNHLAVDPALGTLENVRELCEAAAELGMQVVISGVFDHVSREHPWFLAALAHGDDEKYFPPELRTRAYFTFEETFTHGYACADDHQDAPELNLRNPTVRRRLFTGEDSVLHHWLELGCSGWRILRADGVGYSILRELHRGHMTVQGEHYLVGDIRGFADRYTKDGLLESVVNHYLREAVVAYLRGRIPARQLSRVMRDCARKYGQSFTRAWNQLSMTDRPRIGHTLQEIQRTKLAVLLSYTMPGTAHIFYGDEVGMRGKEVPKNLPKMRWNESNWDQDMLDFHRRLGKIRKDWPALAFGDFVDVTPEGEEEIIAFARVTRDPQETVVVAINRASQTRVRKLFAPVCDLPDGLKLRDLLYGPGAKVSSGTIRLELEAMSAQVLVPDENDRAGARFFRTY